MMRRLAPLLAVPLALVSASQAKKITLHGFVTAVHSPTSFEVDDYKITDDTASASAEKSARVPELKPGQLRIGLEVEIKGEIDEPGNDVRATAITALHDDAVIEGDGLVESTTNLSRNGEKWSGTVVAAGETVALTKDTLVTIKQTRTERKELQKSISANDLLGAAITPEQIGANTFANYQGTRQLDGTVLAKKVEFERDYVADEEQYNWKLNAAHVDYSNSQTGAGTLTVGETEYTLFPCPVAQEYLTRIGTSLIPDQQRDLPDKSPGKIQFRFFLIDTDTVEAGSYPNGIVVVSAHVFDDLDDEAQLAFMLAHDMARATEKQGWRVYHYHRAELLAVAAASGAASPFTFGGTSVLAALAEKGEMQNLQRDLDAQADRVGLEYMQAAGYDPREAAETWRSIARDRKERANRLFWGHHDFNLPRRSYLEAYLQVKYGDKDFSTLKKDSPEFHSAVEAIRATRPEKTTK